MLRCVVVWLSFDHVIVVVITIVVLVLLVVVVGGRYLKCFYIEIAIYLADVLYEFVLIREMVEACWVVIGLRCRKGF